MKTKKRIILVLLAVIMGLWLTGCAESSEAKLARLEREAAEARERARQSQEKVDLLENFLDKYGN